MIFIFCYSPFITFCEMVAFRNLFAYKYRNIFFIFYSLFSIINEETLPICLYAEVEIKVSEMVSMNLNLVILLAFFHEFYFTFVLSLQTIILVYILIFFY